MLPLAGAITGETPEVHDDDHVGRLGLAIRLGVEGSGHLQLGTR